MTLDEAIEHAKQVAETCDNSECAADHIQLVEWLRQARGAGKAARWYTRKVHELKVENAELREELKKAKHDLQVFSANLARLGAENVKLRELVSDMGKMLTIASWTSVENDEQASQCIYRAEALGIEVDA